MSDTGPVPIEGGGVNAEPVKVTETSMQMMPLRDAVSQRLVVGTLCLMVVVLIVTVCYMAINKMAIPAEVERFGNFFAGSVATLLVSTAIQKKND